MNSMPFRVSVCGKDEISSFADEGVTHLLSLEDPGVDKDTPPWLPGPHLQLHFHDVESEQEAMIMQGVAAKRHDVQQILKFGARCHATSRRQPVHLLVHCWAGISRSPAACLAIVTQALGPGLEPEALAYTMRVRPECFPNRLIVQHADDLLNRGGDLVKLLAPARQMMNEILEEWAAALRRKE